MSDITAALPPKSDPWYQAPAHFTSTQPGTILRIRPAIGPWSTIFPDVAAVYNILFRTTDSHYKPSWGVTTLFVPANPKGHALLSHQLPYNTVDLNSSPSAFLPRLSDTVWPQTIKDVSFGLKRGWHVQIPDHEGPFAAFTDGINTGHTVLDAVRAVINAGLGLGISNSSTSTELRVAFWGYSGGALASAWAAELQPHYAPEINCVGAALGGVPSRELSFDDLSGTPFAGLIPTILCGITTLYPEVFAEVMSFVKDSHREKFLRTKQSGIQATFAMFAGEDLFEYFTIGKEIEKLPSLKRLWRQKMRLGYHGVPKAPLFFHNAVQDRLVKIAGVDALVERWGDAGVNIQFERNSVCNHVEESASGAPRAGEWLAAVLDGVYEHEGCTVRDVTVPVPQ